jgi:predicted phage tail protein
MMRSVFLYGAVGRDFGREWRLDIVSPAEAIRALCALRPPIERALRKGLWRIIVGPPRLRNAIELDLIHMNAGEQDIHIVPATSPRGDDAMNVGKIVVGVALVASVFLFPATAGLVLAGTAGAAGSITAGSVAFTVGMSLVFGGVAGLLTPRLAAAGAATEMARPEDRPSFLFNGAVNNSIQGSPVPVVMGTHLVGSILISASIDVGDIG